MLGGQKKIPARKNEVNTLDDRSGSDSTDSEIEQSQWGQTRLKIKKGLIMFAKIIIHLFFGILNIVAPPINAFYRWWTNDKSGIDPMGENYWTRMFRKKPPADTEQGKDE